MRKALQYLDVFMIALTRVCMHIYIYINIENGLQFSHINFFKECSIAYNIDIYHVISFMYVVNSEGIRIQRDIKNWYVLR